MNLILNYKIVKTDFQFKYRKFFDICSVILFYQLIFNKSGISYGQRKKKNKKLQPRKKVNCPLMMKSSLNG